MLRALICLLCLCLPVAARQHKHPKLCPVFRFPAQNNMLAQNEEADRLGLPRIPNDAVLNALLANGTLVRLVPGRALVVSPHLHPNQTVVRPWVAYYLRVLSEDFFARFGEPLQVNSATRPVSEQRRLRRWNRNAAPTSGPCASVHSTGIAVDLQRRGLSKQQYQWLRLRLFLDFVRGRVLFIEEFAQPCFHIVVRKQEPIATLPAEMPEPTSLELLVGSQHSAPDLL